MISLFYFGIFTCVVDDRLRSFSKIWDYYDWFAYFKKISFSCSFFLFSLELYHSSFATGPCQDGACWGHPIQCVGLLEDIGDQVGLLVSGQNI